MLGEKHGFTAWEGRPVTKESSIEAVIAALRKVLGTDKLTELRSVLVERAGSEVALTVTPAGRATLTRGESV